MVLPGGRSRSESDPGIWDDPNLAAETLLLSLEAQGEPDLYGRMWKFSCLLHHSILSV